MRILVSLALVFSSTMAFGQSAPNDNYDIVQAADTLGLRPGMTLAEARAKVAALGGTVQDHDKQYPTMHRNFIRGPNPAYFVKGVGLPANSAFLHPNDSRSSSLYLSVFPNDTRLDWRDENNLVVYYLGATFGFRALSASQGTMPAAEFRDAAHRRYGPFRPSRGPKPSGEPPDPCGADATIFIGAEKAAAFKSVGGDTQADKTPQTVMAARKCRQFNSLDALEKNGQVTGVTIIRYNFALAEQAYDHLTKVVGHEKELEGVAAAQQAAKAMRAEANK